MRERGENLAESMVHLLSSSLKEFSTSTNKQSVSCSQGICARGDSEDQIPVNTALLERSGEVT